MCVKWMSVLVFVCVCVCVCVWLSEESNYTSQNISGNEIKNFFLVFIYHDTSYAFAT